MSERLMRIFLDLLASTCFVLALGIAVKNVDHLRGLGGAVLCTWVGITLLRIRLSAHAPTSEE